MPAVGYTTLSLRSSIDMGGSAVVAFLLVPLDLLADLTKLRALAYRGRRTQATATQYNN